MQKKYNLLPLDREEITELSSPKIRLKLLVKPFQASRSELLRASVSAASSALSLGTWLRHQRQPCSLLTASPSVCNVDFPEENEQHPTRADAQAGCIRRTSCLLKRHPRVENPPSSARCTCAGATAWSRERGGGQLCARSPRGPWAGGNPQRPPRSAFAPLMDPISSILHQVAAPQKPEIRAEV